MGKKVLIIGAGNSGRGFIARLLQEDGASFCFVDKDDRLIKKLVLEQQYSVFVGENRKKYVIHNFQAFCADSEEALQAALQSDLIMVCVGNQNLGDLKTFLNKVCGMKRPEECRIIVCENGISPKTILKNALKDTAAEKMLITQGIIFCTSIPVVKGELDIVAEDYQELPVDYDDELFTLQLPHFPLIKNFNTLMKRKLYTYNCLSGCIAYLGYLKGYTDYGLAARDSEILAFCEDIRTKLDDVMCRETHVACEEQRVFSDKALKKFTNCLIVDTIEKNARAASRKISADERLMGPMQLFFKYGIDTKPLCKVVAAALYYMEKEESLEYKGRTYGDSLCVLQAANPSLEADNPIIPVVREYLDKIRSGVAVGELDFRGNEPA